LHLTSNNTIYGTQWQDFPDSPQVPLIADMSSDMMSRPVDVSKFALIYAGAQKNLGPAGVTLVIIRKDLLEKENENTPAIMRYSTHAKKDSLYHTPPTFSIYMLSLVMKWIKKQGGLAAVYDRNVEKAKYIYDMIDESEGFYQGHARAGDRSLMNITFNLRTEALEQQFLEEAKKQGFIGLNGHRSENRVTFRRAVTRSRFKYRVRQEPGGGTGSIPPDVKGLQRNSLHRDRSPPRKAPWVRRASPA
jgi:phosphoserine aminotransferase